MASADCAISVGFRSSAEPGTTNSVSCATMVGFASAASPVAWAGNQGVRNLADWLPRIDDRPIDPRTNCFTPRWYKFFMELSNRLGGVQGPSMTQVVNEVVATQTQVAANSSYTAQVADWVGSIEATATATAEVTQTNGLSGSGSIPEPGERPVPSGYQPR